MRETTLSPAYRVGGRDNVIFREAVDSGGCGSTNSWRREFFGKNR